MSLMYDVPTALEEAQMLHKLGWTYTAIAERLFVSRTTIRNWLNPAAYEKAKASSRDWYYRNKTEVNKQRVRRLQVDPYRETLKRRERRWRVPEETKEQEARSRCRKHGALVELTADESERLLSFYAAAERLNETHGFCLYHVDHVVPTSRGGKHHPDNLQVIHGYINYKKRAQMPEEFEQDGN